MIDYVSQNNQKFDITYNQAVSINDIPIIYFYLTYGFKQTVRNKVTEFSETLKNLVENSKKEEPHTKRISF